MKCCIGSLFSVVIAVVVLGCEGPSTTKDQVTVVNRLEQDILVTHQLIERFMETRSAHWSLTTVKAGETTVIEASPEEYEPPYSYTIHVTVGGVKKTAHVSQDNPKLVVDELFMQL